MATTRALCMPEVVQGIVDQCQMSLDDFMNDNWTLWGSSGILTPQDHLHFDLRENLRSLALVSRVFLGPSVAAYWTMLPSLRPVFSLVERYRNVRTSLFLAKN
jgi:hypothetical protein